MSRFNSRCALIRRRRLPKKWHNHQVIRQLARQTKCSSYCKKTKADVPVDNNDFCPRTINTRRWLMGWVGGVKELSSIARWQWVKEIDLTHGNEQQFTHNMRCTCFGTASWPAPIDGAQLLSSIMLNKCICISKALAVILHNTHTWLPLLILSRLISGSGGTVRTIIIPPEQQRTVLMLSSLITNWLTQIGDICGASKQVPSCQNVVNFSRWG